MEVPDRIADAIFSLLAARAPGATICPSEVARAVRTEGWRVLMPEIRAVARALVEDGRLEIRQRGQPVPLEAAWRGPIRLALPQSQLSEQQTARRC